MEFNAASWSVPEEIIRTRGTGEAVLSVETKDAAETIMSIMDDDMKALAFGIRGVLQFFCCCGCRGTKYRCAEHQPGLLQETPFLKIP